MWTYETIGDADPAVRLNELHQSGHVLEILYVLPPTRDREAGGLLIRFGEPEPPITS